MTKTPTPSRSASRFLASLPAVLHGDTADHPCAAHNLSRTGVLLIGSIPIPAVQETRLTISSGAGDLELALAGRIVRIVEDPQGKENQLGVEFEEIAEADRPTLEALVSRVIQGVAPAALENLPADASPEQIRTALDKVPVAHRIALAGRGTPKDREVLLQDPSPQVIDALVRNPNLLAAELKAVLRIRHVLPRSLEALARSGKWSQNEPLQILIASHPNTPLTVAQRLVAQMSPEGLKKVVQQPGLHASVRLAIGKTVWRG